MDKQEAVSVLKEIFDTCRDEITVDWVSLNPLCSSVYRNLDGGIGYSIKMKIGIDNYSREKINSLLQKHGFVMKEEYGVMVISEAPP